MIGTRFGFVCMTVFFMGAGSVLAAPLAGETLAFDQQALTYRYVWGTEYVGHSEPSTANGSHLTGPYLGQFAADDFAITSSDAVARVKWWGSYFTNTLSTGV